MENKCLNHDVLNPYAECTCRASPTQIARGIVDTYVFRFKQVANTDALETFITDKSALKKAIAAALREYGVSISEGPLKVIAEGTKRDQNSK